MRGDSFFNPKNAWIRGVLLFVLAFGLRSWSATLEGFPNLWDEQYHAAVAKSLLSNPLEPRLLPETGQDLDYKDWTGNGVWLHKPPLFLWTMAASMKVWGVSVWGLRFPSILLGSMAVLLVWALGRRWFNERAAWWGALWLAVGHFSAALGAGRIPTDHNDVHFAFWIGLGLWTGARYRDRRTYGRAAAVGAAVGAAVLTKWLPGLWAGGVLGLWVLLSGLLRGSERLKILFHSLGAVAVAAAVSLPWNVFIRSTYPLESAYESQYNARHLTEALEGHLEPWWFHFTQQTTLWGWSGAVFLVVGVVGAWRSKNPALRSVLVGVALFFGVYTLAATKMVSFTYGIAVPLAVLIGAGVDAVLRFSSGQSGGFRRVGVAVVTLFALADNARPWETWNQAQLNTPLRQSRKEFANYFRNYAQTHPGSRPVFQNVPKHALPLAVFFTDGTVDVQELHPDPLWKAGRVQAIEPIKGN